MDSALADWRGLIVALSAFGVIVVFLASFGKGRAGLDPNLWARRISSGLERVTGVPGWAAAMVGTASFGLLVAGMGFYNDVAWHVQLGRDEELFTAPHTAIVVGLLFILASAFIGEWFASATKAGVGVSIRGHRVPRSALVMGLIGVCALAGFPLDELWHEMYGIDVTLWSPTHLLMVVGASVSPLASWLALAEAGVRPGVGARRWQRNWATGLHIGVGTFVLLGLSSVQGEFAFGVPQFQQLYHPVLYALAAGFALTAVVVASGRWWAPLVVAGIGLYIGAGDAFAGETGSQPRSASLYVVAGVGVALVALVLGSRRRGRFALVSGLVVGTFGLAGEWWWSQEGWQAWGPALLPDAILLAVPTALAAAVLGAAFGRAVGGAEEEKEPAVLGRLLTPRGVAVAGLVLLVALAWPLPRRGSEVAADVRVELEGNAVLVEATLEPPDAAEDARWFQTIAWQGGDFQRAEMVPTGTPGTYRSDRPIPVFGTWKTMLRLHRGAEMVAIPIFLPDDPEIGASEIPVQDRNMTFQPEQQYLLREQVPGPAWFAPLVYVLLGGIAGSWVAGLAWTAAAVRRREGTVPARREAVIETPAP